MTPVATEVLAGMLPGPGLASAVAGVSAAGLDERGLVELMRAARRLSLWADAVELSAIAELDRRRQRVADRCGAWTVEMSRAPADEVSAALGLSGTAAGVRLGLAIALDRVVPETGTALVQGRIDMDKAEAICDGVIGVSAGVARRVEGLVLPEAPGLTARQVGARVRRAMAEADPEAFEKRRRAVGAGRRVELFDNPDGTADLSGRDLPADEAEAAYNYVGALAAAIKADGDERPIDAIRADVLLRLLRGHSPAGVSSGGAVCGERERSSGAAGAKGAGPSAVGDTGRAEAAAITQAVRDELTRLLAHAPDTGSAAERRLLVAEVARRMREALAELKIRWCEVAMDEAGHPVHGHDGYRPPAGMRRLIQARNHTCGFPTCRRKAEACDLDHTVAYHRGGPACPCNLAPLCRRHHRLKQSPDWTLIQPWPGVLLWIAPTGHCHLVGPDP